MSQTHANRDDSKSDDIPAKGQSDLHDMLTVDELQDYLRCGRAAAYTFARQHGVRVGRLLRVPRAVLRRDGAA